MKKRRKRLKKINFLVIAVIVVSMLFPTNVFAKGNNNLTPIEIDKLLEDVEPVEISRGVYLRDNGEYEIYDIDVSKFKQTPFLDNEIVENEKTVFFEEDTKSTRSSWDLTTGNYSASFKGKFRVFTKVSFTGYDELFVKYTNVNCPSTSTWQSTLFSGSTMIASSGNLSSGTTTYTSRFYNMDSNKSYNVAFQKTEDGNDAYGNLEVYLP